MNEPKNKDFFPEIDERDAYLAAPDSYEFNQDTEEDRLHEGRLKEIEAGIAEKLGSDSVDDLGELPYDEEADRKRWDDLEQDLDRIFDKAERSSS